MEIVNAIYANQVFLIITFGLLGLAIGSFINVLIHRLPIMLKNEYRKSCIEYLAEEPQIETQTFNILKPRSHCPKCKNIILWWHNIPVVSYIMLGGKCKYCANKIAWRYLIVEALTCLATIFVVLHFGNAHIKTFSMLILTWGLIATIFIDLEQQIIPDNITIPLIWLGLLLNANHIFTSPQNAVVGAIAAYAVLWIIARIFKLIRKMDGMGYGDFKLFAVFGAWLGWKLLLPIILVASIMGIIVGVTWILTKKYFFTKPLPFGPYLAISGWLAFFFGQVALKLYSF